MVGCACPEGADGVALPVGLLGPRIGTYLRIEGVREVGGKVDSRTLRVDHVDGQRLTQPTVVWVENLEFPAGTRCAIRGYETGRWIGLPPEVEVAERLPARQAPWQFQRYFVATSVQAPPQLAERFQQARTGH